MHLKSIEMTGFKSFPDKIDLTFPDGITCVVGPNGSGKSNISDAIRWVMGEQSVKTLRGGKMEDVIFSGTQKRKPVGFCEVNLSVDNSDHALPIEFDEVTVTRKIFRSGETEYFLNDAPCRLRDIQELFMDTGLGKDGYSLVGQGKIDEIISGKPSERRAFFEEACGISKYRHRKDEAERKLSNTENNIVRISDIINELEVQLAPLKEQSEKASKYLLFRDELKILEINSWLAAIDKCRDNLTDITVAYSNSKTKLLKVQNSLEALDGEIMSLNSLSRSLQEENDRLVQENHNKAYSIKTFENQIEIARNNIEHMEQEEKRLQKEKKDSEKNLVSMEEFQSLATDKIGEFKRKKEAAEKEIDELKERTAGAVAELNEKLDCSERSEEELKLRLSKAVGALTSAKEERSRAAEAAEQAKNKYLSLKNRHEVLLSVKEDYQAAPKSVKEIMQKKPSSARLYGTVSNLISVEKKYARALDAALGASVNHIVCEDESDAKKCIEYLKKTKGGRVTFLPLSSVHPPEPLKNLEKEKGFISLAHELADCDDKFRELMRGLLNKTAVFSDFESAAAAERKYHHNFKAVTLDGELFSIGGSVTGGYKKFDDGAILRNAQTEEIGLEAERALDRLKKAEELLKNAEDGEEAAREKIDEINLEINGINSERIELLRQLKDKETEINLIIKDKNVEIELIAKDEDNEKDRLSSIKERMSELAEAAEAKSKEIEGIKRRILDLKDEIKFRQGQIEGLASEIAESEKQIDKNKKSKKEAEESFLTKQEKSKKERERLIKLNEEHTRLELKLSKAENEIDSYISNLWDSYELTVTTALEFKKEDLDIPAANKKITELRSKIKSLGNINIDAIEEFKAVSERHSFLASQRDDLTKAKDDLLKIIAEMLKLMKEIFREQFSLINSAFQSTFNELFGGGRGELKLQDEEDILNSGIEIIVQPPGKKLSSISLLSGGEKAFCAIALLFSIIKIKPTPFCLFDEIEAALDDVNVYRYADYLKKFKKSTQFIVITHRRGTMESADTLYGVTMQEKGVSKLLSLNIDEAEEKINSTNERN